MRVAFLVRRFPTLSETFILGQITGLLRAGVDVRIFAARRGEDRQTHLDVARFDLLARTSYLSIGQPRLLRLKRAMELAVRGRAWRRPAVLMRALDVRRHGSSATTFTLLHDVAAYLEGEPFDVVHCQFGQLGRIALALRATGALQGRIVVSFRGADLTVEGEADDYGELFRTVDMHLPVCRALADRLVALGCDPGKIEVHHSGIAVNEFEYSHPCPPARGPTRLLSIARLVEKKGIGDALEAVERLKGSGSDILYTIVGDGPLRSTLEEKVQQLGIMDRVRFTGALEHADVRAMLQESHILIQPSVTASDGDSEGIPNALKEAMAMGLPVVATRHSGIPELIEDRVSGLLVPERDPAALAASLRWLTSHPESWSSFAQAGRARVVEAFDQAKLNRRLLELYQELTFHPPAHV